MTDPTTTKFRYYQKKVKLWTPSTLLKAVNEVEGGLSARSAARMYHMDEKTVRNAVKKKRGEMDQTRGVSGRKRLLDHETEEDIAALVRAFGRARMGIRKPEIGDVIKAFCEVHEIDAWAEKPPTKVYIAQFCERHNLTLRKESLMSLSREEATANPFIIGDFYDRLKECIQETGQRVCGENPPFQYENNQHTGKKISK